MIEDIILKFLYHDSTWRTIHEVAYHSGSVSKTGAFVLTGKKMEANGLLRKQVELRTDEHKRPVKVDVYQITTHGRTIFERSQNKQKSRLKMLDLTGYYSE